MSEQESCFLQTRPRLALLTRSLVLAVAVVVPLASGAATPAATETAPARAEEVTTASHVGGVLNAIIGKSSIIRVPEAISRMSVGNPGVADASVIGPREIYLLGKGLGSTNLVVWTRSGQVSTFDVVVAIDSAALQEKLRQLLPTEKEIVVTTAADSVVLTGRVSDAVKVERAVAIAEAFVRNLNRSLVLPVSAGDAKVEAGARLAVGDSSGGAGAGARVVNLLQVSDPQQVMLEVKVAEVSKTLLDKLGAELDMSRTNGSWKYMLFSQFLTNSNALFAATKVGTDKLVSVDAQRTNGLVKILAEPNIMAISGQKGSFLAGGKVFIPVARENNAVGGTTITLAEREFGIGLTFTPTVLDGGRINLEVAPEVSELQQSGSPFTSINNVVSILPSFTVRRASTTVQLHDGQSFAIAGLIKNNVTETIRALPILGELPIIGALFRSSEFQSDKTELVFVITPRLVKPLPPNYALPTDGFVEPSRPGFFLGGKMEGVRAEGSKDSQGAVKSSDDTVAARPAGAPASAADGGFQTK